MKGIITRDCFLVEGDEGDYYKELFLGGGG